MTKSRDESNPNCEETHVDFRIVGDLINPSLITEKMGIQPDYLCIKGKPLPLVRKGTSLAPTSVWSITSDGRINSKSLESHVIYLLDCISLKAEFLRSLISDSVRVEFHCYWMSSTGHGGPILSGNLISKIEETGASLDFDFYCKE